ncbi:hypothetical protein [Streptomyces antibioticus]|uniref:hypothetical protein n=1 Tax=Streptomyces antibioticus TaxID=1890 RepID=UPI003D712DCB
MGFCGTVCDPPEPPPDPLEPPDPRAPVPEPEPEPEPDTEPEPPDVPEPPPVPFGAALVFRAAGVAGLGAGAEALGVSVTLTVADTETGTETEGDGSPRPGFSAPASPPAEHPTAPSTTIMVAQGASPREPPVLPISALLTDNRRATTAATGERSGLRLGES